MANDNDKEHSQVNDPILPDFIYAVVSHSTKSHASEQEIEQEIEPISHLGECDIANDNNKEHSQVNDPILPDLINAVVSHSTKSHAPG